MYPKKPPSQTQSAPRKYLNLSQKEALKAQIADRLARKYGLKYSDLINTQVNNAIDNNNNMTADVLQKLDNNIKQMTSGQQQPQQYQNKGEDEKSIKSGHSKMSGASNFDIIDQMLQQSKSKNNQQENLEQNEKKNKNLATLNITKPEKDLDFLEEEDEWAAIFKYNRYLFEKEAALLKEKERKQKLKIKADLDKQVSEKADKKMREKYEDQQYSNNLNLQLDRFDERERQKKDLEDQIRAQEKLARMKQMKENKYKRRHEEKQEKALDSFLMLKVREELDAEQKYMEFKKEHQRQVMDQLRMENEVKLRQAKMDQEAERQENIQLMQAYAKLIDDQDEERERTMKERDQKMKDFQLKASITNVQENEEKLKKLDDRRQKYENRHEVKLQQIEQQKIQQTAQQKAELKEYLLKQMDQRQDRQKLEKTEYNKQADIWQEDSSKYDQFENEKKNQKQQVMSQYSQQLRHQLLQNEEMKKNQKSKMNENEALLNKHLLGELDQLKEEIQLQS